MASQPQIRDLLTISSADFTEVNIRRDLDNTRKMEGYVPNEASRRAMEEIFAALMPTSPKRAHLLTGMYGTGKSHFGLVLAALLRKRSEVDAVLTKVGEKDERAAQIIRRHLNASKKFLVVVPDYLYSSGFNRTLLVALQEALEREKITFRPRSYYSAAIETIDRWEQVGQKTSEDNPYKKLEEALATRQTKPSMLKDSLSKFSDEAYDIFREAHKEVAYGAEFQPDASAAPEDIYSQTIEYLRSTGEWEGACVICDEFGEYLATLASDPDNWESRSIQKFVEYCKRSDQNQCHFVIIAHRTLADYVSGYGSQKEWEKTAGRFIGSELSLDNVASRHETVEMVSVVITRRQETDRQKKAWLQIAKHSDLSMMIDDLRESGLYDDQEQNWLRDTLIIGCFPLHPFATYCLPWLAQRVGQRERTLFKFFDDPGEGGLRHFVSTEPLLDKDKRLNLYTADRLIYYFGTAAEGKPLYNRIMRARQEALSEVGDLPLAQRLVNTLAVFGIVGPENLQSNEANLISAMRLSPSGEAEAKMMLTELAQARIVRQRRSGVFELRYQGGDFNSEEAIRGAKEELRSTFSTLDSLRGMKGICETRLSPIQANSYEEKHFVTRVAVRELVIPRSLSNPNEFLDRIEGWYEPDRKKYEGDVLILYVLAESANEISQAKRYAAMEACHHPQLVIAIPKEPVQITEKLLEILAIKQVRGDDTTPTKAEADIEELDQMLIDESDKIGERLDNLMQADHLVWYCNGDSTATMAEGREGEYVSGIMESCFSETPVVKDEDTVNILRGRDSQRQYRHLAMTRLLEHTGYIEIQKRGGKADERILRYCLRDTEILVKKEDRGSHEAFEVRDKLPKGAPLREIWQLLRKRLVGEKVELGDVVRELLRSPYGLSHQLIEVLLAAFFRNRLDEFVIWGNYEEYKKKHDRDRLERINLSASAIASIVSNPDDYVLAYYEVQPTEREYVNGIIEVVAKGEEEAGEMGIWDRGRDALLSWFTGLPPITTSAKAYANDSTGRLVDLLKDPAALQEAKELFRILLPGALDLTLSSPTVPTEAEAKALVEGFEQCYIELTNFAENQARILIKELVAQFGGKGSARDDLAIAIKDWRTSKLAESQQLHVFGGDAGHLKSAVGSDAPIVQRMLEDLPAAMGLGVYTSWTETTVSDLFLARVELARQKIESWQPLPPPEDGEDDGGIALLSAVEMAKTKVKAVLASLELPDDSKRQVLEELLDELKQ